MTPQQTYWLEELKQADSKLEKLEEKALEVIKFYFLTLFSIVTLVLTLYNYGLFSKHQQWIFLFFILPFIFGLAAQAVLKKIITQYATIETNRNQISEWFIKGEVKNEFTLAGNTFFPFYSLISWLITFNFFIGLYFLLPSIAKGISGIIIYVVVGVAVAGILSSVVLASLNTARKKARDARRKSDIANIRLALELYKDEKGSYPITNNFETLLELLKDEISFPISDPTNTGDYRYGYESSDGQNYKLIFVLEEGGSKEIDQDQSIKDI